MAADEPLDSATDWVADHTRQYVENDGGEFYMWRAGSRRSCSRPGAGSRVSFVATP